MASDSTTDSAALLAGAEQFGADGLDAKMEGKDIQEGLLALSKVDSRSGMSRHAANSCAPTTDCTPFLLCTILVRTVLVHHLGAPYD